MQTWAEWLCVGGLALLLTAIVLLTVAPSREAAACERRGGVYAAIGGGHVCVPPRSVLR